MEWIIVAWVTLAAIFTGPLILIVSFVLENKSAAKLQAELESTLDLYQQYPSGVQVSTF